MGLVSIIESDINVNGIDLCFMNHPIFETEIRVRTYPIWPRVTEVL